MTFRIEALPIAPFQRLFDLSDEALMQHGARRMIAETPNSAPCRVSLLDAAPGEVLILAHHQHVTDPFSPYRSGGPVFVREAGEQARPGPGQIPDMLARRLLSVRVYDSDAMMLDADVVEGADLTERLTAWLADPAAREAHIHTARRGCYLARATRA
jgi:hypothetical protein